MVDIRAPEPIECDAITLLCLRSKAYWGYDAAFMEACRSELSVSVENLTANYCRVACGEAQLIGFVEISVDEETAELEKLFVEPDAMGSGVGKALLEDAVLACKAMGVSKLAIAADPGAVPFYKRMGAEVIGETPSGSIAGRQLPLLELALN